MSFFQNITFRGARTRTQSEATINDDSKNSSKITIDESASSLPDMSASDDNIITQELRKRIDDLTLQLTIANEEIENLSLENTNLKETVIKLTQKNDMYKKVTVKTLQSGTPKKVHSTSSTPIKKGNGQKTITRSIGTPPTAVQLSPRMTHKAETTQYTSSTQNKGMKVGTTQSKKRNMCIISTNKRNELLQIARETFNDQFNLCHYLTPGGRIKDLLKNLSKKVESYTHDDYCLVMIGEADFLKTDDYCKLVFMIREATQEIDHTNIIICLPTYKCGEFNMMFNSRVEIFNNLVYLDALTYKHVYVYDTNCKLSYDHNMFNGRQGVLNNYGMRCVFSNLKLQISHLQQHSKDDASAETYIEAKQQSSKQNEATVSSNSNSTELFRV